VCLPIRCLETGSPIDACVFVAAGMCLPSRCLAMDVCSGSTIPAFRPHVQKSPLSEAKSHQFIKKSTASSRTRRLSTMFTTTDTLSYTKATWIQFMYLYYYISFNYILIFSFLRRRCLLSCLFHSSILTILIRISPPSGASHMPAHLIVFDLLP
jgi:hypothetical protein